MPSLSFMIRYMNKYLYIKYNYIRWNRVRNDDDPLCGKIYKKLD